MLAYLTCEKISIVFKEILRIPENIFEISNKDKEIILKVPQQILVMKEQLSKSLEEIIPIIKDYNLIFEIKK